MHEPEVWKVIYGYPDYQAPTRTRIRSMQYNKDRYFKKACVGKHGYHVVNLYAHGKVKLHLLHHLVADHFVVKTNDEDKTYDVDHIDRNKSNTTIENLRYISHNQKCMCRGKILLTATTSIYKGLSWMASTSKWSA